MANYGMTIDEHYGLPGVSEDVHTPLQRFPHALMEQLKDALAARSDLYRAAEWTAFKDAKGTVYLKATLDVGDRPFHLYLHEDGSTLQFDAPVLLDFPKEASHFVLTELCGRHSYLSFRVDRHGSEVLYAWGRFEFRSFVEQSASLLPYLITWTTQAEKDVRGYLETSSRCAKSHLT